MNISAKGLRIIKHYEGCQLRSYLCPAGVWTVGYGSTKEIDEGMIITHDQADEFLKEDVAGFEKSLNSIKLGLNQNQFDACICLIFNIGFGAFKKSTLLRRIKLKKGSELITDAFLMWVKATVNGKKVTLKGLEKRRQTESDLYVSGYVMFS